MTNSSTWQFKELEGNEANDALEMVNEFINKQNPQSVKVCVSDMRGKDARAVVFFKATNTLPTDQPTSTTRWSMKTRDTDTDYNSMYNDILSDLNELGETQQFYASIAFTNAKNNNAHMAIYYPTGL